jgi:site-specific DNA-methyltransferase (adenine-specific)
MTDLATNVLYYGDNLDILRRYLPDAAVDLVYLDPPFNSNRDYNVIFRDESGNATDAQLLAFEDTWHSWSIGRGDLRLPDQHRSPRGPRAGQKRELA